MKLTTRPYDRDYYTQGLTHGHRPGKRGDCSRRAARRLAKRELNRVRRQEGKKIVRDSNTKNEI